MYSAGRESSGIRWKGKVWSSAPVRGGASGFMAEDGKSKFQDSSSSNNSSNSLNYVSSAKKKNYSEPVMMAASKQPDWIS